MGSYGGRVPALHRNVGSSEFVYVMNCTNVQASRSAGTLTLLCWGLVHMLV
jgi:hypothetical protein